MLALQTHFILEEAGGFHKLPSMLCSDWSVSFLWIPSALLAGAGAGATTPTFNT